MPRRPVVFVTRTLMPAVEDRLKALFDARLSPDDRPLSGDEIAAGAAGADALLICPTDRVDAGLMANMPPSVKIIACHAVGVDNVDLAAAGRRGIVVTNTPDVLSAATAEVAILLMLGAARRAFEAQRMLRAGQWRTWAVNSMLGTEMTGKRLGIIGMGRIGRLVADMARGFHMEIHYWNRRPLPPEEAKGALYHPTLEALLPISDFLSLHCPLTAETKGLLNADRLALLPQGAVVVNTARGPVIEDEALIAALKSGQVAAAGLDVFTGEPNLNPGYLELDNVFLLPHIGSATVETRTAMGMRAVDNLAAYFNGEPPRDRVA